MSRLLSLALIAGCTAPAITDTASMETSGAEALPAPAVREIVDMRIQPRTGTVSISARFENAPPLFLVLVNAPLRVRCADGLVAPACEVRRVLLPADAPPELDPGRPLWAIHGDTPSIVVEGVLGDEDPGMHGPPLHVGADLVELDGRALVPVPLSFALDHVTLASSYVVEAEPSVAWPSPSYEGPFEDFELTSFATADLVTEQVACAEDAIDVTYDEDFPGRERALDLARLACEGIASMRARWGEPDGSGPFRLWLTPRRGRSYYLASRTLVVAAYTGRMHAPVGGDWSAYEDDAVDLLGTDYALMHEASHAWFSRTPSPAWPNLYEGIATYAAWSTMLALGRVTDLDVSEAERSLQSARARVGTLSAYQIGGTFLSAMHTTGRAADIDTVLRALHATGIDEAQCQALVREHLGDLGTEWLAMSRLALVDVDAPSDVTADAARESDRPSSGWGVTLGASTLPPVTW